MVVDCQNRREKTLFNDDELALTPQRPTTATGEGSKHQALCGGSALTSFEGPGSGLLNIVADQVLTTGRTDNNCGEQPTAVKRGSRAKDTRRCKKLKRLRNAGINSTQELKQREEVLGGGVDSVRSQLERVVERMEKAVQDLPKTTKNKKIKRTISIAAVEVRDFTRLLKESTKVEGMLLNDDKAVVVLSSDSSEEFEGRGTKRKSRATVEWKRETAVSSRLSGKGSNKQRKAAEIVFKSHKRRLARFPVRKVKAGSYKISTALK